MIIEKVQGTYINEMEKKKFLIPADISMSQLVWIIRKRVHMESERALYIYVGKTMPLARSIFNLVFYLSVLMYLHEDNSIVNNCCCE